MYLMIVDNGINGRADEKSGPEVTYCLLEK